MHPTQNIFSIARSTCYRVVVSVWLLLGVCSAYAQGTRGLPPELMPHHPAGKELQRANIDAKRAIENMYSDDALPRSREFKRTDSSYYVGWMFEGVYKYNHAADYLGFKNAATSLEKALYLLERDYRKQLYTRSSDIMVLLPAYNFQIDYTTIASDLVHAYNSMDEPEKAMKLLRRSLKYKFQREYYLDIYNLMAWTVHRNRFYTSAKYSFLKNSIDENEALANSYLDSAMRNIERNKSLNANLFPPGYVDAEKNGVYHYKNILHAYNFHIDSANYYFELMRKSGRLPHNNYANFRSICGDFRTAEAEYKLASEQDAGDKRLQEWAYFTTILDIYKANPKTGAELARNMIRAAGTTPGYGWYNIALARSLTYDGQVTQAEKYVQRAADFHELHIGTTLGQSHYDFSLQLIKLLNKEQEIAMLKFEHRNWWYNPVVLWDILGKYVDKYIQQFLIINQFSHNPERDRVIYKLFSTENVVTWDEIWYLIKDFSTNFFLRKFSLNEQQDNRRYIRKYFGYFVARLKMEQGKYNEARTMLNKLLHDPDTDAEFEKLFTARIFQAQAICADHLKKTAERDEWIYRLYEIYPQLIPFSGLKPNMELHLSGSVDPEVVKRLQACNINWVGANKNGVPAPQVYLSFAGTGSKKVVNYSIRDQNGVELAAQQHMPWSKAEKAGVELAYRIFNIGGPEPEPADTTAAPAH